MRSLFVSSSVLAAGLLLAGCSHSRDSHSSGAPHASAKPAASAASPPAASSAPVLAKAPRTRPDKPLNVLLITVDALRSDMPWNGYSRPIAPNLSKLVSESVYYDHAYSISSYTAKSLPSLLAGRYPSTLYRDGYFFTGYSKANFFFSEELQEHGIRTMGGQAHMYFKRGKNVDQGFDVWKLVPGITFDPQTDNDITSDKMTKMAIDMLSKPENTGKQFFAWFHYLDPHDKYNWHDMCPKKWGNKARDRYDCEVFFTDHYIGKLFDWAKTQSWWKNTAVILTADHGEAFGEHGMYRHAFELWQELVHVPLAFKLPGVKPRRVHVKRSDVDLAPTIVDLMGLKPAPSFEGKTMVPELYGAEKPADRDPIVLDLPNDTNNEQRRAIIEGDYKLIVFGDTGWKHLLFNLKKDPGEKHDLSHSEPDKLEQMEKLEKQVFDKLPTVQPYGGAKIKGRRPANGPMGPPKQDDAKKDDAAKAKASPKKDDAAKAKASPKKDEAKAGAAK